MKRLRVVNEAIFHKGGELMLDELLRIPFRHKSVIFSIVAIFVTAAVFGAMLVKPQWEAVAVVQIGQVWQVAMPLESPSRTVERMRLQPFRVAVLEGMDVKALDADSRSLFNESYKVRVLPNTDFVELRVRAYSPEDAKQYGEASVAHLQITHEKLAIPLVTRLKQQLSQTQSEIEAVRREQSRLLESAALKADIGPGNRFAENILLSNLLMQTKTELRTYQTQKLALEEQLDPGKTYATSLLDKVYVTPRPVHPQRSLIAVLGGILGFLTGVVAAFALEYSRSARK